VGRLWRAAGQGFMGTPDSPIFSCRLPPGSAFGECFQDREGCHGGAGRQRLCRSRRHYRNMAGISGNHRQPTGPDRDGRVVGRIGKLGLPRDPRTKGWQQAQTL